MTNYSHLRVRMNYLRTTKISINFFKKNPYKCRGRKKKLFEIRIFVVDNENGINITIFHIQSPVKNGHFIVGINRNKYD